MNALALQILLAKVLFAATFASGVISMGIMKMITGGDDKGSKKGERLLSMMSCFSGGVFMGVCYLDIFPDIAENYDNFLEMAGIKWDFPMQYLWVCAGFFAVYLMEEACLMNGVVEHQPLPTSDPEQGAAHNEGLVVTPTSPAPSACDSEHPIMRRDSRAGSTHDVLIGESVAYMTSSTEKSSFLKSLTFAIAMSFHSILEGFALGVQETTSGIIVLFLSLVLHKAIEAFGVGLQVSKGNIDRKMLVMWTLLVYSLMTPIGSILGAFLQSSSIDGYYKQGALVVFEGMAAGTFIYVTFLEVLAKEKENDVNSMWQLLSIFAGFLFVTGLQLAFAGLPEMVELEAISNATLSSLATA